MSRSAPWVGADDKNRARVSIHGMCLNHFQCMFFRAVSRFVLSGQISVQMMIQLLVLVENDRRGPMFDRFPYGLRYGFGSRVLQQLPQGIGQRFWVIGLKGFAARFLDDIHVSSTSADQGWASKSQGLHQGYRTGFIGRRKNEPVCFANLCLNFVSGTSQAKGIFQASLMETLPKCFLEGDCLW